MSLKLRLGLNQKIALSQRLRQSLSILSLSYEELLKAIQQELLENPFLSEVKSPKGFDSSNFQMPLPRTNHNKTGPVSQVFSAELLSEPESLRSYILKQVDMSFFPKEVKAVMLCLISYLDDRAYLNLDIEELSKREKIPLFLVEQSLKALQSLEPVGLGGRDLKECLLIQLRHKKEDTKQAQQIVQHHLQNIKEKKFRAIAYDLNISLEDCMKYCRMIQSLEPFPGRNFSPQPTTFIRPDIYIYKQNSTYYVTLNQEEFPRLRVSSEYRRSIKRSGQFKPQEQKYFRDKIISAHWFLYSVKQRQEKIKKIAYYLIHNQRDFLEKGSAHLKPLRMQDMAEALSVHVSTISRAVYNKYAWTPQGMVDLRSFFQKGLKTENGAFVSKQKIKQAIKQWVKEEKPSQPLSDKQLKDKVYEKFHICLLRRSVSLYRSSMGIPPIRVRRLGYSHSLDHSPAS